METAIQNLVAQSSSSTPPTSAAASVMTSLPSTKPSSVSPAYTPPAASPSPHHVDHEEGRSYPLLFHSGRVFNYNNKLQGSI